MVKNWSKIVLVSLLIVALAAPAFATTARVRSLANSGDYLSDDSNVFRWYSTLPSYAKMVQAEIGAIGTIYGSDDTWQLSDTRALGFNYGCGEDAKYGTYRISLHENAVDHPGFYIINPLMQMMSLSDGAENTTAPFNMTPVNKWDLAGGWEIGENVVLGIAYTRSSFTVEDEQHAGTDVDPTFKQNVSWSTYGLGVTWTNNEDLLIDATFTYAKAGGEWEQTGTPAPSVTKIEWDKSSGLELGARLFYDWKDYVTVVPVFDYMQSEYALTQAPNNFPPPNGDKNMGLMVGVGLDIEVNGSNTLIFATEYNMAKWEYSVPDTTTSLLSAETNEEKTSIFPTFRLALESEITSWLTTRIGAIHRNLSFSSTKANKEIKWTNDSYNGSTALSNLWGQEAFSWFLGCGFNVAEWTIDMELNHRTPFSLGYWLTGYSWSSYDESGAGPVLRISGVYSF
jgi:hypothetical protein